MRTLDAGRGPRGRRPRPASTDLRATVRLKHAPGARKAEGYQYSGAGLRRLGGLGVRRHGVRLTFPALSVTLIRVPLRS